MKKQLNKFRQIARNIKKKLMQLNAYDFPSTGDGWKKYSNNPVLGGASSDIYFDPFVRYVSPYYLMCVSNRTANSIEFYYSSDGVTWGDRQVVLSGIPTSSWEQSVNRACFLKKDDVWYLWYTGQNEKNSSIGLAISYDGEKFERITLNPLIVAEYEFEKESVMNPCVLWNEDSQVFQMWYAAGENYEPDMICYAESSDGSHWKKQLTPVKYANKCKKYEQFKIGACDVVKSEDIYYMVYIAYQNVHVARICLATSKDGIEWIENVENPILGPEHGKWDSHSLYKPTICFSHSTGDLLLWYNGRTDKRECIGMAYKGGVEL